MCGGGGKPKKAEASHCSVVGGFRRNSKGDFEEASMDVGESQECVFLGVK